MPRQKRIQEKIKNNSEKWKEDINSKWMKYNYKFIKSKFILFKRTSKVLSLSVLFRNCKLESKIAKQSTIPNKNIILKLHS